MSAAPWVVSIVFLLGLFIWCAITVDANQATRHKQERERMAAELDMLCARANADKVAKYAQHCFVETIQSVGYCRVEAQRVYGCRP